MVFIKQKWFSSCDKIGFHQPKLVFIRRHWFSSGKIGFHHTKLVFITGNWFSSTEHGFHHCSWAAGVAPHKDSSDPSWPLTVANQKTPKAIPNVSPRTTAHTLPATTPQQRCVGGGAAVGPYVRMLAVGRRAKYKHASVGRRATCGCNRWGGLRTSRSGPRSCH